MPNQPGKRRSFQQGEAAAFMMDKENLAAYANNAVIEYVIARFEYKGNKVRSHSFYRIIVFI